LLSVLTEVDKFRFAEYVDPIAERYDAAMANGKEIRFRGRDFGSV
jgi:hypothetical protein